MVVVIIIATITEVVIKVIKEDMFLFVAIE